MLLQHKGVDANGTARGVRGLPAGICFVRITPHVDMSIKRLIRDYKMANSGLRLTLTEGWRASISIIS